MKVKYAHRDVFKRNYAPGFLVGGEFKVVEAVVVENEPSTFPALVPGDSSNQESIQWIKK